MSSFEDIYQRVLLESSAETMYDRLVYITTNKPSEIVLLLYPFLQVFSVKTESDFHEWYYFLDSLSCNINVSAQEISDKTKQMIQLSTTNPNLRRLIELLVIKIKN
jgi:hypothetical protein